MTKIAERTALITGASGGIGTALCSAFAAAGYHVIATDLVAPHDVIDGCTHVAVDLNQFCIDDSTRTKAVHELRVAMGGRRLNVLINNAAVQIVKHTEQLSPEDWSRTLNVNVIAPFLLAQAFLPELEKENGSVLNISSIHATLTKPEFVAYATSKAALSGLTRSLAIDLGGRVRINAISPAAIQTPMLISGFLGREEKLKELGLLHPIGRIGASNEVAALALFLSSEGARFITGSDFHLDGGIGARLHDSI